MIALYPYRQFGAGSEQELCFSIRSLCHYAAWCAGVCVVGDVPDAVMGELERARGHGFEIRMLRVPNCGDKYHDVMNKLRLATKSLVGDSERVVLMNDDFFLLASQAEPPRLHIGPLGRMVRRFRGSSQAKAAANTMRLVGGDFPAFEAHNPMELPLGALRAALQEHSRTAPHLWRTLVAWKAGLTGQLVKDQKIFRVKDLCKTESWEWFSTSDRTGRSPEFRKWAEKRWPACAPQRMVK